MRNPHPVTNGPLLNLYSRVKEKNYSCAFLLLYISRGQTMLLKLILIFTIVPFIELSLLIELGSVIGTLNTILVIIVTGVIGAFLARVAGLTVLFKIQENLRQGIFPRDELFDGILILIAGAFLLTPGLLTDGLGFFLLLPLGRAVVKRWLKEILKRRMENGEITFRGNDF